MTTASICTIGDEILIGQIVDTNSARIATALTEAGVRTRRMISIGDKREEILENLRAELCLSDVVITTGGLGPTKDDITKNVLAELSGSESYVMHEEQLRVVVDILSSRGLEVLDINRAQALVPDKCSVIVNKRGTAPIMCFYFDEETFGHKAALYAMPGVPFETEAALPDVVGDLKQRFNTEVQIHKNIMTYGIAESALSKLIGEWEDSLPEYMHLAYLPNPLTGVRLRLSGSGQDAAVLEAQMQQRIDALGNIASEFIYSYKDDTLQSCIGEILRENHMTVCAAESCTGGTISSLFTSVPGCSDYYLGSVTSYANSVKIKVLGVPSETIDLNGAVSFETAYAMAHGVKRLTGADFSVVTTGIAGPGGATPGKPVGLVWVGVATPDGVYVKSFNYKNDRVTNIKRFAASALNFLRVEILKYINNH